MAVSRIWLSSKCVFFWTRNILLNRILTFVVCSSQTHLSLVDFCSSLWLSYISLHKSILNLWLVRYLRLLYADSTENNGTTTVMIMTTSYSHLYNQQYWGQLGTRVNCKRWFWFPALPTIAGYMVWWQLLLDILIHKQIAKHKGQKRLFFFRKTRKAEITRKIDDLFRNKHTRWVFLTDYLENMATDQQALFLGYCGSKVHKVGPVPGVARQHKDLGSKVLYMVIHTHKLKCSLQGILVGVGLGRGTPVHVCSRNRKWYNKYSFFFVFLKKQDGRNFNIK